MAGKTIILLLLIAIMSMGGIFWFDYLNIIDAKTVLAPVYKYIPFIEGEGRSQPAAESGEDLNLDAERLAVRLEALNLKSMEMDSHQMLLDSRFGEIEQMAQELEVRQKMIEEMEKTLRAQAFDAENKERNVEQNARYLTGMKPDDAVRILSELGDQDVIDMFRKTEELAQAEGTASLVPVWLSRLQPARAAELQRKMAGRPPSL